ncbi:MerR family transcriptional regulator [Marinomonas sp. A79]|uniref:MerR family transcriptional regulator n=1 Tax=Marinomonas vulgaris TaxID=2823372 RepID=A0ABS5HB96_9GAMM|nr:MerR family transcriptional regulator [Marinomonas vulgaris]MBR7888750.1 MerR family transcriptional regulator [Marinomonas vulgaris]
MTHTILRPSAEQADEARFPIRELSLKTGVNSVTLRAWERRYGLLKPKRTDKGHRLYDQGDVLRVEGILRWIQQGVAVSKVRALLEQETAGESTASAKPDPNNEWLDWQQALVVAAKAFQEEKVLQLYQDVFSQYPAEIAVRDGLLPSFEQLGKGAELAFCESVVLTALMHRVGQGKGQSKSATKVLITGLSSQRILWCYMAAAMLLDKGVACLVLPNAYHSDDWSTVVSVPEVHSVLVFCDNELAAKSADILTQMDQWQKPVAAIGAGFWLAAHEAGTTRVGQVSVYSEALEGVLAFIANCQGR